MLNEESLFINECILSGVIKKPISFRMMSNHNEQCIMVIELLNSQGEAIHVRLVSFNHKVNEAIKSQQLNEGDKIKVLGSVDVIRWVDVKSQTNKSRQSIVINQVFKLD